jgi:hypothetical protein
LVFPFLSSLGFDPVEGVAQDTSLVVRGHRGVERGGRGVLVADLLLDEQGVEAIFETGNQRCSKCAE